MYLSFDVLNLENKNFESQLYKKSPHQDIANYDAINDHNWSQKGSKNGEEGKKQRKLNFVIRKITKGVELLVQSLC